jgi:hypothetical protein
MTALARFRPSGGSWLIPPGEPDAAVIEARARTGSTYET